MIKRCILAVLAALSFAVGAAPFVPGQVLTAGGLNSALDAKTSLADLSASGSGQGSALVGFKRSGTGTVARTVADKLEDSVHAKDFGVKCDGATNDTAAINAMLTVASGRTIVFPAGSCLYAGGGQVGHGTVIVGAGRNATFIRATAPAATLFTVFGFGAGIRGMAFYGHVTQTGGTYVALQGTESFIDDFYMDGDFNGILMTGGAARIRHGRFQSGASGSIRIRAEGGDTSQVIDDVLIGGQSPQVSAAGIRVRNSSALIISNTSVINQHVGLLVDPYTSTQSAATDAGSVFSLWVQNSIFDNNDSTAIRINPSGTGSIVRSRFANVWASSSGGDGLMINNSGTGMVSGLHFESLHAVLNTGSGVSTTGTISDLSIAGGEIAENAYGIRQNSGVDGFRVRGALVGAGAGLNGNTNAAITLAASSEGIVIAENDLRGNGSALVDNATAATYKVIRGNVGYNPLANTAITVTASPFNWTNRTGEAAVVFVTGGTVSSITVAGKAVSAATNAGVLVPQGASAIVTYSAAPTMSYSGI